jgi:outer membrane protein W
VTFRLRSAQALACALILLAARPAFAQARQATPVRLRPFFLAADQRFAAQTTFDAVFSSTSESLWGGGADVVIRDRYFVDLAISRMSKSGQRAFLNNGDVFRTGIPLHLTSTPVEVTAGYRFRVGKSRIIPYAGAGIGSYSYHETADFAAAGDDVDARHAGFVMMGGAEFRVSRWVGITGDAQYTKVPGILGQAGISKDANESDFGGIAARLRVILGR